MMDDETHKTFMREYFSKTQHWRLMKLIEHLKALAFWWRI
jgi:hypothetical protein